MVAKRGGAKHRFFFDTRVTRMEEKSLDLTGYDRWRSQNILILPKRGVFYLFIYLFGDRVARRGRESLGLTGFGRWRLDLWVSTRVVKLSGMFSPMSYSRWIVWVRWMV